MAYPGKNTKSYQTPKRPWEKSRIESETRLVIEFGLRNKREVWKAQEHLRKYRKAARNLLALGSSDVHKDQYDAKKEGRGRDRVPIADGPGRLADRRPREQGVPVVGHGVDRESGEQRARRGHITARAAERGEHG